MCCLLGVDDRAAAAEELLLLEAAGVELRRVELDHGPVFENIEAGGHRRQRWFSSSDVIPVAALPDGWERARARLIVPVAGEVGEDWAATREVDGGATLGGTRGGSGGRLGPTDADSRAGTGFVGVGWQGMLRQFTADGWVSRTDPHPSALLGSASLVVASMDDLGRGAALDDLQALAPSAVIVLTAGEGGGLALGNGAVRRYAAIPAQRTVDATGAGDVFLAALTVAWLLSAQVATPGALRFAAAAASCSVEGAGLAGVPARAQVAARLRQAASSRGDV